MVVGRISLTFVVFTLFSLPQSAQVLHNRADHPQTDEPEGPKKTIAAKLSVAGYEHLLNILFPSDRGTRPGLDYTMVLRFEPYQHPECQVVIRRFHNGKVETSYDRVIDVNAWRSAYRFGDELANSEYEAVAQKIPVLHNPFEVTDEMVDRWHTDLFPLLAKDFKSVRAESRQIERTGAWKAMVNGTRYELWLIQGDDQIHLITWDSEVEPLPNGTTGLALWMNTIRWMAQGHLMATHPPAHLARAMPTAPLYPGEQDVPFRSAPVSQPADATMQLTPSR